MELTKLLKHFVTFIKYEVLDMLEVERLFSCQCKDSAWSANNNVWTVGFQGLLVFFYVDPTKKHCNFDIIHVFRKPFIFFTNLKS